MARIWATMASTEDDSNPLEGFWLEGDSLAPPCQAELDVVDDILTLVSPSETSVIYDLGCGDGRICLRATERFGCKSLGCEIEEDLYKSFEAKIKELGLTEKIKAVHGDLRDLDLSQATIIVLYLLPESVESIKKNLLQCLADGIVIVCNTFSIKGIIPIRTVVCGENNGVTLYLYDSRSLQA